ncbi:MAG: MOSC N-terminal beta barrel domain-containing protein, partial [Flavobacteriales bacterium]
MTSTIRELFVYPIKSLEGIACDELVVGDRGAVGDRRWMLVDEEGRFITQREHPKLCRFNVSRG